MVVSDEGLVVRVAVLVLEARASVDGADTVAVGGLTL